MISNSLVAKLNDPSLAVTKAFVAGEWLERSQSGKTFDVTNPATGELIATLPDFTRMEARRAISAAHAAQKSWAKKTGKERAAVLRVDLRAVRATVPIFRTPISRASSNA